MESVVETDHIDESSRVSETDLVGKVPREIAVLLEGSDLGSTSEVEIVVDACACRRQFVFAEKESTVTNGRQR